jgi:hypothetical protein
MAAVAVEGGVAGLLVNTKAVCLLRFKASVCAARIPFCTVSATLRTFALVVQFLNEGKATAAKIPIISNAIAISIKVNPDRATFDLPLRGQKVDAFAAALARSRSRKDAEFGLAMEH